MGEKLPDKAPRRWLCASLSDGAPFRCLDDACMLAGCDDLPPSTSTDLVPGVRLHHPTARNCRFTISEPDHPYPSGPYQCTPPEYGGCGQVHVFKTHHLNLDETGSCIVGDGLFVKAQAYLYAHGFVLDSEVINPPTLGIGLATDKPGSWGNIPIIHGGNNGDG